MTNPLRHRVIILQLGGYQRLATELGVHPETVKSWQKADRGIPPRYWLRIAKLGGWTPDYLRRTSPRPDAPRRAS